MEGPGSHWRTPRAESAATAEVGVTAVAAEERNVFEVSRRLLLLSAPLFLVSFVVFVAPESRAREIRMRSVLERESSVACAAAEGVRGDDDEKEGDDERCCCCCRCRCCRCCCCVHGEPRAARPTTQATAAAPPSEASGACEGASRVARAEAQRGARSASDEGEEAEGAFRLREELFCFSFSRLRERPSIRRHRAASSPRVHSVEEGEEQGSSPTAATSSSSVYERQRSRARGERGGCGFRAVVVVASSVEEEEEAIADDADLHRRPPAAPPPPLPPLLLLAARTAAATSTAARRMRARAPLREAVTSHRKRERRRGRKKF